MTGATMRLIEAVERLNMSGEIGDGMVATLHDLAAMARLEQNPADVLQAHAARYGRTVPNAVELHRHCEERVPVLVADGGRCRQCGCPR